MSKRRTYWDEAKIKRYIKEGRGQGQKENYKPWLTIQDFPSEGTVSRDRGWKTNRVHHFMSNHEMRYFLLLDWSDIVVDIREQFPLDRDETVKISENLGIEHPTDRKSKVPIVMTTDFLITINHKGDYIDIARTIKPAEQLDNKRVIEKFEIERRYWMEKGIGWGIVTEKEIPTELCKNIDWVHSDYKLVETEFLDVETLLGIGDVLKLRLKESARSIAEITNELDKQYNLEPGNGLLIFRHLVAIKEIVIDMQSKINLSMSARQIKKIITKEAILEGHVS